MGPLDSLVPGLTLTYLLTFTPSSQTFTVRTADNLNLTTVIAGTPPVVLLMVLAPNSFLLCSRQSVSRTRTSCTHACVRISGIAMACLALALGT